jgi:hypothetical protein
LLPAVSSLGGFRTPAPALAPPSCKGPAFKTLHRSGSSGLPIKLTACEAKRKNRILRPGRNPPVSVDRVQHLSWSAIGGLVPGECGRQSEHLNA